MSLWSQAHTHGMNVRTAQAATQQENDDVLATLRDLANEYRGKEKGSHLVVMPIAETTRALVKAIKAADEAKVRVDADGVALLVKAIHPTADEATVKTVVDTVISEEA